MSIDEVRVIELPKFLDDRGNLSFVQNLCQIPFEIRRTYWLYDVPGGESRGEHAERENEELIIAISGSINITVDDGRQRRTFFLNRSYYGLYIPKGLWRGISDFSTNALALEFGSIPYDPNDYISSYESFLEFRRSLQTTINDTTAPIPSQFQAYAPTQADDKSAGPVQVFRVSDCPVIELENHRSNRKGNLTVVENGGRLPFNVQRAYYLYDVPAGESRGSHAHRELQQLIVAASGSFRVTLDDGIEKRSFTLKRPYQGLLVRPGMWRDLDDFSSGAVCMVLASDLYNENDYIRDYQDFIDYRKHL